MAHKTSKLIQFEAPQVRLCLTTGELVVFLRRNKKTWYFQSESMDKPDYRYSTKGFEFIGWY